jgi:hypothetical protein
MGAALIVALAASAVPLPAQEATGGEEVWRLGGLRNGFCVHLLIDSQIAARSASKDVALVEAGRVTELHPALRSEIESEPDKASWSPSRLCIYAMDTVQGEEFTLADKSGRKPQILALWTVEAADRSGGDRDLALLILTNSDRLVRAAHLAGHTLRKFKANLGKVPEVDEDGVPSSDDRVELRVGKTLVTWDGRQVADSSRVAQPIAMAWSGSSATGRNPGRGTGRLVMTPAWSWPMVGSLKVEGKGDLAEALKASPVRFVGPLYRGGGGEIRLQR